MTGGEAHHALHVVRIRDGEEVQVLDGAGTELHCRVRAAGRREVHLDVLRRVEHPRFPTRVTLFQAVTKTRSMDWIVQKAAELGCDRLVPVLAERSVPRFDPEEAVRKAGQWREIAIEALKQCGWPWLTEILPPQPLASALPSTADLDLGFVASLRPDARHARIHFDAFRARHGTGPRSVGVWVGPEGDYTAEEYDAIAAAGVKPVSLGPRVLRAETAAVSVLATVNYELEAGFTPPRA